MMRVYGAAQSRSTRVLWTLEELGWDYDYIPVDLFKGLVNGEDYSALNPAVKVPLLEHDNLRLTESAAICQYLADLDPERRLAPQPDTEERAKFNQWCFFVLSELEQPLWTLAKHSFILPETLRSSTVRPAATHEFSRMLAVLEHGLADQPYILGGQFSIADVLLANTLTWARGNAFTLAPSLNAYADRLLARPALARACVREQLC